MVLQTLHPYVTAYRHIYSLARHVRTDEKRPPKVRFKSFTFSDRFSILIRQVAFIIHLQSSQSRLPLDT